MHIPRRKNEDGTTLQCRAPRPRTEDFNSSVHIRATRENQERRLKNVFGRMMGAQFLNVGRRIWYRREDLEGISNCTSNISGGKSEEFPRNEETFVSPMRDHPLILGSLFRHSMQPEGTS